MKIRSLILKILLEIAMHPAALEICHQTSKRLIVSRNTHGPIEKNLDRIQKKLWLYPHKPGHIPRYLPEES